MWSRSVVPDVTHLTRQISGSHILFMFTGCLTDLLESHWVPVVMIHAYYTSSKMILQDRQVEKSDKNTVNVTDSVLFVTNCKVIITKCSSVMKIWAFA